MNKTLIEWSKKNYSELPWRTNRSLYGTLVSEIMLQQTTVGTVLKHFDRFMAAYPTVKTLAQASQEDVMKNWQGLGYYRRARSLHSAAIEICEKFNGEIPTDKEELLKIKGIGDYTASALRSIGANIPDLSVDANLERVLARFYAIEEHKGPKLQKKLRQLFENNEICQSIESLGARNLNEALMDLGRRICQARTSACELCPLKENCQGRANPLMYPVVKESLVADSNYFDLHLLRLVLRKEGKVLVYKKRSDEWLSGQYEVPTFTLFSEDESLKQYPQLEFSNYDLLPWLKTGITKYRIMNFVMALSESEFSTLGLNLSEFSWEKIPDIHLSTGSLKAISLLDK
ncbi:MAG: hypothetical protein VYA54_04090 [Bdellovibrionota bacterium]|nr:hypothetical protein [Bdellovibrionota bacterium]